jgi:hypothetical protein
MDEHEPLLPSSNDAPELPEIYKAVEFDPNGDPENPLDWSNSYKWGVILLLAFMAFTVYAFSSASDFR